MKEVSLVCFLTINLDFFGSKADTVSFRQLHQQYMQNDCSGKILNKRVLIDLSEVWKAQETKSKKDFIHHWTLWLKSDCWVCPLTRLSHCFRLLGGEKVLSFCLDKWLEDIKVNQLPTILGGFGPLHAFVQLGRFFFSCYGYITFSLLNTEGDDILSCMQNLGLLKLGHFRCIFISSNC